MGGLLFSQSYLKLHKVFKGGTETAAALSENVKPELLKGEGRGRVNVLLLGRGGGTHDAPDLTDTIMLASIDPVNHTTTLLSIPRDLWVNVPGHGVMKLNAAWETGEFQYSHGKVGSTDPKAIAAGYNLLDQTLEDVLGIQIDYHMLVDFQAFKQAVDTVGGVNINVPTDLVDPTMAWENQNNPVLAKAGLQAFDGTHALIYVRSRETSSDFARSERQRSMLLALKGKVISLGTLSNPLKISSLINAFGNNVQTDLSLKNANRLYNISRGVSDANTLSISLADKENPLVTTGNINGQSVVLPKAGLYKYDAIQTFVRGQLKDPYILKENAKILILNGTSTPGMATAKANELKSYGYNVIGTANTPAPNWGNTTLVDLTHHSKYTKNYLEQRLGRKALTKLADTTIPTNGADFVIIIGSDEATPTQYQAN
jgi:LCP family protein required for cell wall assembly